MIAFTSSTAEAQNHQSPGSIKPPLLPCRTQSTAALVADHLAEQGWGSLADGTIVWEDDHRVTPVSRHRSTSEAAEP